MSKKENTDKIGQFTNADLRKLSYRWSWNRSLAWNYEKMMTAGYMTTMIPVIDKLYKDDEETRLKAYETQSAFFNSEPNLTNIILGMDIAIEEELGKDSFDTVMGVKTSLMGPFAGIGDTLFTSVLATIFGSIAVTTALQGSYVGIIIWEIWLFFVTFGLRPYFMQLGYKQGINLITTLSGKLKQITSAASVLGLCVVGAMIASMVKIQFGVVNILGTEFDMQASFFDAIIPKSASILVVALCYWLLGKLNMKSSRLILIVMAACIVLSYFGILVRP